MSSGSPIPLSVEEARAVWFTAQGLGSPAANPCAAVERSGPMRTLGGVDVYLALRARTRNLQRADVDAAVERGDLVVAPGLRGCIYLTPRDELGWCLRLADLLSARRREREHDKAGIRPGEIASLADTVEALLADRGPSTPDAIRSGLPGDALRALGDVGKKVGISSTLPPALRHLELAGRIERRLESGRLDSERYLWQIASASPFADVPVDDARAVHAHFAERFLTWSGIGDTSEMAAWAGLGKRDARSALEAIGSARVEIAELDGEHWALPEHLETLRSEPQLGLAFLPFEDNLVHLQGGPAPFVDRRHHGLTVPAWGRSREVPLGVVRHSSLRSIVADGRIVGFWELDPDRGEIVRALFDPEPDLARRSEQEAADVASFLERETGHGRSFSLDTEDTMTRRAQALARL